MHLLTFCDTLAVQFRKSAGGVVFHFEPRKAYIMSGQQYAKLAETNAANFIDRASIFDQRIENFNVNAHPPPRRILAYNGAGGYGDQILAFPVFRVLAEMGYEVHVLSEPGNNVCWQNFPWVKSVQLIPVLHEMVKLYDNFVVLEHCGNLDEHQDQDHPVDAAFHRIGIDPSTIPAEKKRVAPVFTSAERARAKEIQKDRRIALYQISPTAVIRSLNPDRSAYFFGELAASFPDLYWIGVYDEYIPEPWIKAAQAAAEHHPNAEAARFESLRDLWALAEVADLIIGPDSMLMHLAGALERPCVSYWGATSPESRAKYYPTVKTIYHKSACERAACFATGLVFPRHCPSAKKHEDECQCLAQVTVDEIITATKECLQNSAVV